MNPDLYQLMSAALKEAGKGLVNGEVPVGAVVADADGRILARAHNRPIGLCDPTAHAEVLAIRRAAKRLGNYRLGDALLVVTMEPCPMCMGAALHARIPRLAFGARDPKAGAVCSVLNLASDERLNHRIEVIQGVMEKECRDLIQGFFRVRRTRR
jgi:tRNA(adenine34) deaminase